MASRATIFLAMLSLMSCAQSPAARRLPFEVRGRLEDSDIQMIVALVNSQRRLVSKHIWEIEVRKPDSVKVSLGFPERLGGELLFARKRQGQWAVTFVGVWAQ